MRSRLKLAGGAICVVAVLAVVVLGALALSDRVANEAIERAPLPRSTSTPVPTAPPIVSTATASATPWPDLVTSVMPHPDRQFAAGVLLADGRVLVVGGRPNLRYGEAFSRVGELDSAVIYDPRTNEWTETTPPPSRRAFGSMVLAGGGNPLIWGGFGRNSFGSGLGGSFIVERYDWLTAEWARVGLPTLRGVLSMFELGGRVYALTAVQTSTSVQTGDGGFASVQTLERGRLDSFDPIAGTWTTVSGLADGKTALGALPLADGRVLVRVEEPAVRPNAVILGSALRSLDATLVEYILVDPRTGERSEVRTLEGPPYRPQFGALPDGDLLIYGGFAEDPTAWEAGLAVTFADGEIEIATPEPAPIPPLSAAMYRLDLETGDLILLKTRPGDPDDSFRLTDDLLVTSRLPSMPMTADGLARFLEALEGRWGAVVVPLDGSRVLIAGGSLATPEVDALALAMASAPPAGQSFVLLPPFADIEAAIVAAGLDASELRYARPEAVIVRVN